MKPDSDLVLDLLSSPMYTAHYQRLDRAWKTGQLLPLAGSADPVPCMDSFTRGLQHAAPQDEDFQVFEATGLVGHLLQALESRPVDAGVVANWLDRTVMAYQPAILRELLALFPQGWTHQPPWIKTLAASEHPQAPAVMQVLIDHAMPVASTPDLLHVVRSAPMAKVLIDAGADPVACSAAQVWADIAEREPESFDKNQLMAMLSQIQAPKSDPMALQALVPLAPSLGVAAFKKQVARDKLDPATILPDGRSLPEHLCLSGMRTLFGHKTRSHAWEQQAIGQAKIINWALTRLPQDHPRMAHARAACLLAHATMRACAGRNFGALCDSTSVEKLGALAGHNTSPEPASLVHAWLVQAVDDGLLGNGSTIAASMLSQSPEECEGWLAEQCHGIPETAAMALLRCAARHRWDPRWQTPDAPSRLVTPQYDSLSKLDELIKADPGLLSSPSPLLVLSAQVFRHSNDTQCKYWLARDPGLVRLDPRDPDLEAFLAFAGEAFAADPVLSGAVATAQSRNMNKAVDQPARSPSSSAPRL